MNATNSLILNSALSPLFATITATLHAHLHLYMIAVPFYIFIPCITMLQLFSFFLSCLILSSAFNSSCRSAFIMMEVLRSMPFFGNPWKCLFVGELFSARTLPLLFIYFLKRIWLIPDCFCTITDSRDMGTLQRQHSDIEARDWCKFNSFKLLSRFPSVYFFFCLLGVTLKILYTTNYANYFIGRHKRFHSERFFVVCTH